MKKAYFPTNAILEDAILDKGYTCKDIKVDRSNGIKAISMFSGAGGLDIGTQLAGIPVLSSLDIFEDSVKTMQQNSFFKDTLHECGDITRIDGTHYAELLKKENPDKLILVGGPPCQPFSKAGYWVTNEKRNSSEDPRNLIVPYFKIISDLRPDGFVLENVESILHPSNHEAVETIAENMERLGYHYSMTMFMKEWLMRCSPGSKTLETSIRMRPGTWYWKKVLSTLRTSVQIPYLSKTTSFSDFPFLMRQLNKRYHEARIV